MVTLSIHFLEKIIITDSQVQLFVDSVRAKVEAMETDIEINKNPFAVSLQLEFVFYSEQDIIESILKSLEEINIRTGRFSITLTELAEDDAEFETPPYFEEEIDISEYYNKPEYVTLSIEFCKSKLNATDNQPMGLSFSDADIEALRKELSVITENPIVYYGEVLNTNKTLLRLVFEAQPAENIPEKYMLKENIVAAIQKSNMICESFTMGTYIKSWDNTLWQEEVLI
jgi:hypothetical protein